MSRNRKVHRGAVLLPRLVHTYSFRPSNRHFLRRRKFYGFTIFPSFLLNDDENDDDDDDDDDNNDNTITRKKINFENH